MLAGVTYVLVGGATAREEVHAHAIGGPSEEAEPQVEVFCILRVEPLAAVAAGLPEPILKAAEEVSCGWSDVSDVV